MDYAQNVLSHAGFSFQPRTGKQLPLRRVSKLDIAAIVRHVDVETLSSWLEDVTFCEMSRDDLRSHSDDTFLKLFQLAQLILEYLADTSEVLAANVNGLAKKNVCLKVDVNNLKTILATQDAEIATLRDELHVMKSVSVPKDAVSCLDPSFYPTQERRPATSAPPTTLEDLSPESPGDAGAKCGYICVHIVLSARGVYLQMNVEDSITVSDLESIVAENVSLDAESYSLFHKSNELKEKGKSLHGHGIESDAALVFMPRSAELLDTKTTDLDSRLNKLTSNATESREELLQAIRTLQSQVSLQESNKEAFMREIKQLVDSISQQDGDQNLTNDAKSPLLKWTELDQADEHVYESSNSGGSEEVYTFCKHKDEDDTNYGKHARMLSNHSMRPSSIIGTRQSTPSTGIQKAKGLKIDTSAEVLDRASPFNPPTDIEVWTSDIRDDNSQEEAEKETAEEKGSLAYSASSTQLASSISSYINKPDADDERTPTSSNGYLDHTQSSEEVACASPPWSGPAVALPEKKFEGATYLRCSDYSVQGITEIVENGAEGYCSNVSLPDNEYIPDITLDISLASWPPMALDSDMQSIEVSHSTSASRVEVEDKSNDNVGARKKKKYFSFGIKHILPRWKKSKSRGLVFEI